MKKVLLLFSMLFWLNAKAQYIPNATITAAQYGSELNLPFIGGLTAPQFSDVDVNFDGINDLFIFDRGTWLPLVLIKDEDGNFSYHPEYANNFPVIEDWVLLRDFNCDGIMDIFTYYIGSTRVYKGIEIAGEINFTLEKSMLEYADFTGTTALYTSRTDIPAIDDIDSDGDLDILSFSVSNSTIRFYENVSVESGFGCDSLIFELNELCWGSLYEGFTCYGGDLHVACKGGDATEEETENTRAHIGSTIVTYDQDGDGDVDAILGDNSCNNLVYYRNGGSVSSAEMDKKDS
ncbi:MAG TPA: VCBS repeat-containing protein, partial [Chitinophagales bacterium]|nr:VCBS repeat-containing protein [Chitinophagales bacterium]